jgi:hypothetical protein
MLIPIYYVLMSCKCEEVYLLVFHHIKVDSGGRLNIHSTMHDFEMATVASVFNPAFHTGCFFHMKQALRAKMVDYKFSSEFIREHLPLFDFLTVCERSHLADGVEFIRHKVLSGKTATKDEKATFEDYLDTYFKNFWLTEKVIQMFNYVKDWKAEL